MDYARKACVTLCSNLVTESQKYVNSHDFGGNRITFSVFFAKKLLHGGGFFVKVLTREDDKGLQITWPLKYDTLLRK